MKAGPKSCLLLCSSKKEINICKVSVEGTLYEFLCLCFGLNSAPLLFTKTSKVTISLLRRLHIRVIIYLDNMLLKSQTLGELQSRDTIFFLLIQLGFVVNLKKSFLVPVQKTELLGLEILQKGNDSFFKERWRRLFRCLKMQWKAV